MLSNLSFALNKGTCNVDVVYSIFKKAWTNNMRVSKDEHEEQNIGL